MEDINNVEEWCYIMDYSVGIICEIPVSKEDEYLDPVDLLDKFGFKDSECAWMFTRNRITDIEQVSLD